jgi:GntR family transcriptional regulator
MSTLFEKSPIPLYLQVADTMRQRIAKGVWRVGEVVPTLEDIASEFGVGRVTARQAMQILTQEGLLSPKRGKGTYVSRAPVLVKSVNLQTSLADLASMYETTTPQILTIEESNRTPRIPAESGSVGPSYVHMRRVHFLDEQPYSVISLYLLQSIFTMAPMEFRSKAVIPILLQLPTIHIDDAHQTMAIETADAEVARLLHVPAGSPIAHVERVFKDLQGQVLYYAEVCYRGDWVKWRINLKP